MKRVIQSILLSAVVAASARGGLVGSRHDFVGAGTGWNKSGERCLPCHTPHHAVSPQIIPLWNHQTTTATFTLYASATFNGAPSIGQPGGVSLACLSCHDGTVALENYSGRTNGTVHIYHSNLGTDLQRDHPIWFTYDTVLAAADGRLHDPAVQPSGLGGTIAEDLLINGRIECTSCHDPHGGAGVRPLLVKSNAASSLCLTCHRK